MIFLKVTCVWCGVGSRYIFPKWIFDFSLNICWKYFYIGTFAFSSRVYAVGGGYGRDPERIKMLGRTNCECSMVDEIECPALNGTSLSTRPPSRLGEHCEEETEMMEEQEDGRRAVGDWLLDPIGLLYAGALGSCGYPHKTFTGMEGGGAPWAPVLTEELLTGDGCQGRESLFSLGVWSLVGFPTFCGWLYIHGYMTNTRTQWIIQKKRMWSREEDEVGREVRWRCWEELDVITMYWRRVQKFQKTNQRPHQVLCCPICDSLWPEQGTFAQSLLDGCSEGPLGCVLFFLGGVANKILSS